MGFLRRLLGLEDRSGQPTSPQVTRPSGYYVYAHADADGDVFYIGKGTGGRAWSRERHAVWQRYVTERLDGEYQVVILRDGLTEDEALTLEGRLVAEHGEDLVNWINPGRRMDFAAIEERNALRDESKRLTELAKVTAEEDPEAGAAIARKALTLVHEYAPIETETGPVEELRPHASATRRWATPT